MKQKIINYLVEEYNKDREYVRSLFIFIIFLSLSYILIKLS